MASQATQKFISIASGVISELEKAIARNDKAYYNAEIALKNVRAWNNLAIAGALPAHIIQISAYQNLI